MSNFKVADKASAEKADVITEKVSIHWVMISSYSDVLFVVPEASEFRAKSPEVREWWHTPLIPAATLAIEAGW